MNLPEAKDILIMHQKWRRDENVPSKYPMVKPYELGEAIDVILEHLKTDL